MPRRCNLFGRLARRYRRSFPKATVSFGHSARLEYSHTYAAEFLLYECRATTYLFFRSGDTGGRRKTRCIRIGTARDVLRRASGATKGFKGRTRAVCEIYRCTSTFVGLGILPMA